MIAYLDCSTGVSGDKVLGALLDAGASIDRLEEALAHLRRWGLGAVSVEVDRVRSAGVSAVQVRVHEAHAPRRTWAAMREILESAELPGAVTDGALRALSLLAEAEARVHGVPVDEVHFHEVGAADTLVDALGVALALADLGIGHLAASPVAVGGGTVAAEHGTLPVPAPATALLLEGVPIVPGPPDAGELTTPTGAALLRAFVQRFGTMPEMTLRRVGTGCGTRDIGVPNVCRVLIGEPAVTTRDHDEAVLLETNLDHLTPEELATAAHRILDAGALDVWQTPVVMKKGRAAIVLSVLASPADAPMLAERVLAETGTLGVRIVPLARRLAERETAEVATSLGVARFKVARLPDGSQALRVEADDAARIAAEHGIAVDAAARILEEEASRATGVQPMRQRPSSSTQKPSA